MYVIWRRTKNMDINIINFKKELAKIFNRTDFCDFSVKEDIQIRDLYDEITHDSYIQGTIDGYNDRRYEEDAEAGLSWL